MVKEKYIGVIERKPLKIVWNNFTYGDGFYVIMLCGLFFSKMIYNFSLWFFRFIKRIATRLASKKTMQNFDKKYGKI